MILTVAPAPELSTLIRAYWFIEDLPGKHAGEVIRTSPVPLAILSVNIGRANASEDGSLVPGVSLLGLQSRARSWHSFPETYFVMAMLTVSGMVRFFPHSGSASAGKLVDVADITGDASVLSLASSIGATQTPEQIASVLDGWFLQQKHAVAPVPEYEQMVVACDALRRAGSVNDASSIAELNRRQLHRLYHRHFGIGPKEYADMERLHFSLKNVQTGQNDALDRYSDQAHQIRNWRRRLGVTPGAYRKSEISPMVRQSNLDEKSSVAFYL